MRRFGGGLALVARRFLAGAGAGAAKNFVKSIFVRRTDVGLVCSLAGSAFAGLRAQRCRLFASGRRRSRGKPVRWSSCIVTSWRASTARPKWIGLLACLLASVLQAARDHFSKRESAGCSAARSLTSARVGSRETPPCLGQRIEAADGQLLSALCLHSAAHLAACDPSDGYDR